MDELGGMDMDRWFRSTNVIVVKLYQRLVGLETLDQSDEETWPDQQKTKIQVDEIYDAFWRCFREFKMESMYDIHGKDGYVEFNLREFADKKIARNLGG